MLCPAAAQGAGHAVLSEGRQPGQKQSGGHRQNTHVSHCLFPSQSLARQWQATGRQLVRLGLGSPHLRLA